MENNQTDFNLILTKYIKENDCGFSEAYKFACEEVEKILKTIEDEKS